ncbi:hypothetical protein BY996DRAFT_6449052 [Phakopsora pachyrhizi]|nr:hypothetical protein BY996DRAFT_6449052 [Phakopsora pachyrhizi]
MTFDKKFGEKGQGGAKDYTGQRCRLWIQRVELMTQSSFLGRLILFDRAFERDGSRKQFDEADDSILDPLGFWS